MRRPADPASATACFIALILGGNGPIYPLYVIAVVGWADGHAAFLTMGAMPLFLAIPALARRAPAAAPVALWLVGTLNTLWCMKLLGPASLVGVFLLPCAALAALLPTGPARLAGAGLPLLGLLIPHPWFAAPILRLTAAQDLRLASLNLFSAGCLSGLIGLRLGRLIVQPSV
jgi:hypothetical protein